MSVVVGYCSPGQTATLFTDSLADLMRVETRIIGRIGMLSGPRIATARNLICSSMLDMPQKPEWLFMVDADMGFEDDIVDRFLEAAHPKLRPVVGGLCFSGGRIGQPLPTLSVLADPKENDGKVTKTIYEYPKDALCKVDATGAAGLFVHRDVLVQMHEEFKLMPDGYPNPHPWFSETVHAGHEYGEDWTFCMRLRHMKVPLYVHTGIKLGHQKNWNYNEEYYMDYRRRHGNNDEGRPRTS